MGTTLSYYKVKPGGSGSGGSGGSSPVKAQGTIDLTTLHGLTITPIKDNNSGGAIMTLDTKDREWMLECSNIIDVNRWRNVFDANVDKNNGGGGEKEGGIQECTCTQCHA